MKPKEPQFKDPVASPDSGMTPQEAKAWRATTQRNQAEINSRSSKSIQELDREWREEIVPGAIKEQEAEDAGKAKPGTAGRIKRYQYEWGRMQRGGAIARKRRGEEPQFAKDYVLDPGPDGRGTDPRDLKKKK